MKVVIEEPTQKTSETSTAEPTLETTQQTTEEPTPPIMSKLFNYYH